MAELSITKAWNETAAFVKREAGLILPVALLLFAVPGAALQLAMPVPPAPGQPPEIGIWLLLLPLVMIASIVGSIAISYLALRPGASVAEALQHGLRRFIILFAASLLIALGLVILLIPFAMIGAMGGMAGEGGAEQLTGSLLLAILLFGILVMALWIRLMLMTPVAAAERAGPIEIIRRSWALTRGHFWKLAGMLLLLVLVAGIVIMALSAIIGILVFMVAGPPDPGSTSLIVMTIVSSLLQAVFSAIFVTMLARIYAQLAGTVHPEVFA